MLGVHGTCTLEVWRCSELTLHFKVQYMIMYDEFSFLRRCSYMPESALIDYKCTVNSLFISSQAARQMSSQPGTNPHSA